MAAISLDHLRRYAVARSLFAPTTLARAIARLGFVQADPIRAPARAQDLTLRHRVRGYRAGDLERLYPRLAVEEDALINYGFMPRAVLALMHPRRPVRPWSAATRAQAEAVLAFVRAHGPAHPSDVHAALAGGRRRNGWGGTSSASTLLLEGLRYRGLLRVARREAGIRIYEATGRSEAGGPSAPAEPVPLQAAQRARQLFDLVLAKYAPLPSRTLGQLARALKYGAPQLARHFDALLQQARAHGPHTTLDGVLWLWPAGDDPAAACWQPDDRVRLLAPFDPVVWDRARFEQLWRWVYRFEAYTPAPRRKLGYYALPLLWRDQVIGWGNLSCRDGRLHAQLGYVAGAPPRAAAFKRELAAELAQMAQFLRVPPQVATSRA